MAHAPTVTILIVEDSLEDQTLYRRLLMQDAQYTYQILEADYGEVALALCQQSMPDMILLDFQLPDLDGLEFLEQLALQQGHSLLPVIMLTGQGDEQIAVQAMKAGAQDYLVKGKLNSALFHRTVHNVLERMQLQRQFQQSQAHLATVTRLQQAILDGANYLIISTTPEGLIQTFNVAAQQLLGYTPEDVIGKVTPAIFHEPEELQQRAQELSVELGQPLRPGFETLVAKARLGIPDEQEWIYVCKDGARFPVFASVTALRDEKGQITGFLGICNDITHRKQAEADIRKALETEKELNQLKSHFITMASHQFRTPLAIITSSVGILQDYHHRLDEPQRKNYLHQIQATIRHMTQLLEDVLVLNQAEADQLKFNPQPLDLIEFCHGLMEEMPLTASQQRVTLSLPQILSETDQHRLRNACVDYTLLAQILKNLLANAIKYSPQGGHIQVELILQAGQVIFQIQDQGIGIPPADQSQLFDAFHRGQNVGKIPGTGLGLAIVKKCVDRHGGTISITSQLDVGTTARVSLPLPN
ncbi:MAG: ATP-binding protein [Leptolyngbyaceae bacterium]|nr:ATP-binding protein [Leptolyngbyaceae bacterium]